jgi:hypothetical protein
MDSPDGQKMAQYADKNGKSNGVGHGRMVWRTRYQRLLFLATYSHSRNNVDVSCVKYCHYSTSTLYMQ